VIASDQTTEDRAKYGRLVDEFRNKQIKHGVNGTVYVVNSSTIFIKGFSYHNKGVDAFFHIKNRGSDEILKINFPAGGSGQ
jgi:Electron transfer DM13